MLSPYCIIFSVVITLCVLPDCIVGVCWDTGCQLNSWSIRGCEQYNMSEVGKRNCTDGIIYSCCDPGDNIEPTKLPVEGPVDLSDCWDTGCQLNSWSVKGCAQYGRKETSRRSCDGGIIYTCCATGGSGFGPNTVDFI